jgi:hypothetical protein
MNGRGPVTKLTKPTMLTKAMRSGLLRVLRGLCVHGALSRQVVTYPPQVPRVYGSTRPPAGADKSSVFSAARRLAASINSLLRSYESAAACAIDRGTGGY